MISLINAWVESAEAKNLAGVHADGLLTGQPEFLQTS